MAIHDFTFEGLEELQRDLLKVIEKYPDQTEKEVYRLAGEWTKDVNQKLSDRIKHPGTEGKKVSESWKRNREYGGIAGAEMVSVEIRNTAPHWHLIENGHVVMADPKMAAAFLSGSLDPKKRKGKKQKGRGHGSKVERLGMAPGLHCGKETAEEWDNGVFQEHVVTFVDRMLKEENL